LPLNVLVSAANRHDSLFVEPILDSMPAIRIGGRGHPRRRPVKLHGDKGYDNPRVRRYLRRRGITARIACIGVDSSARLSRHRWVVERTLSWLLSYKRLALRYDPLHHHHHRAGPAGRHPHLRPPAPERLMQ
jgi:transposase